MLQIGNDHTVQSAVLLINWRSLSWKKPVTLASINTGSDFYDSVLYILAYRLKNKLIAFIHM